jgi:flagellar hook protein FlgE
VNNFVRFMNQDGFSAGSLQTLQIDEDGFVTGLFSNGTTQRLAQIALANFPNAQGLTRVGDNNWAETTASGSRVVGSPNQGGFGAVRSGFLELSNVDLADEFVKLILAQRAFQANTRTVSTTNELLANLVVLGQ